MAKTTGRALPTMDMVKAPRGYSAWRVPATADECMDALLPLDGSRGLLKEVADAVARVVNNRAGYDETTAEGRDRIFKDSSWHDRTVTKVLDCYRVILAGQRRGTALHTQTMDAMTAVTDAAQDLTSYGQAESKTPAGQAAFVAAQRVAATAKPARTAKPAAKPATAKPAPVARVKGTQAPTQPDAIVAPVAAGSAE